MAGKNQPSGGRLLIEARDRDLARRQAESNSGCGRIFAISVITIGSVVCVLWGGISCLGKQGVQHDFGAGHTTYQGLKPNPLDGEQYRPVKLPADRRGYPRNFGANGDTQWTDSAYDALQIAQIAVERECGPIVYFDENRYYVVEERSPGWFHIYGMFGTPNHAQMSGSFRIDIDNGRIVSSDIRP